METAPCHRLERFRTLERQSSLRDYCCLARSICWSPFELCFNTDRCRSLQQCKFPLFKGVHVTSKPLRNGAAKRMLNQQN